MKRYEIIVEPTGGFGTPMKGDTLFGHFCWQAVYDERLLNGKLDYWLQVYNHRPFVVFSSAFPRLSTGKNIWYVLKRPDVPLSWFLGKQEGDPSDIIDHRKRIKNARWMAVKNEWYLNEETIELWTDRYLSEQSRRCTAIEGSDMPLRESPDRIDLPVEQPHNSIHRLTGTTGNGGMFAPYVKRNCYYPPKTTLSVLVLIDEEAIDIDRLCEGLRRIGSWGFGRDASTGLGRFDILQFRELPMQQHPDASAGYAMCPIVPVPGSFQHIWFSPFVRFGKHGDRLAASSNPFKNPVIMADEGAVIQPADPKAFERPYWGRAVSGISKVQPGSVCQGYAPYLPIQMEKFYERDIPLRN